MGMWWLTVQGGDSVPMWQQEKAPTWAEMWGQLRMLGTALVLTWALVWDQVWAQVWAQVWVQGSDFAREMS